MFNQYYNASIKKLVIAFGNLFNQIQLETKIDGNTAVITVPLTYGPKEKFIRRLNEPSSISDTTRIQTSLPRMGFEISSIMPDPARRLNRLNQRVDFNTTTEKSKRMFSEAPYNITFTLYAFTRNIDENLQIMEEILPYFSPEFIVSLNMNDLHQKVDVPIVLNDVGMTEIYEGDFSTRRYITSTYKFTAKAYVYGYLKKDVEGGIIRDVDVDIFEDKESPLADILIGELGITG
jgi:hypothetical protein